MGVSFHYHVMNTQWQLHVPLSVLEAMPPVFEGSNEHPQSPSLIPSPPPLFPVPLPFPQSPPIYQC